MLQHVDAWRGHHERFRHLLANPNVPSSSTSHRSSHGTRGLEGRGRGDALVDADPPIAGFSRGLDRNLGLQPGTSLKIAARGDDWIRLETASWFMTAHGIVHIDDHHLSLALFIRYDHPIASLAWMPESAMHRRAVPVMLRQALTSHDSRSGDIRQQTQAS